MHLGDASCHRLFWMREQKEQVQRVQCFAAGRMRFCSLWKAFPTCMSCRSYTLLGLHAEQSTGLLYPIPVLAAPALGACNEKCPACDPAGWLGGSLCFICKRSMDLQCSSSSTWPLFRACNLLLLQAAKEHGTWSKSSASLQLRTCSSIAGGDAELYPWRAKLKRSNVNVMAKQRGKMGEESGGLMLFLSLFFIKPKHKRILDKN